MTTETCNCFKCDGKGHIEAFGHYAQGVCFQCNGSGVLPLSAVVAEFGPVPEDTRKKCDWILSSTPESFAGMNWARINVARNFAHTYTMGPATRAVYGDSVINAWRSQGGEDRFQELQEQKRAELDRYSL